ncbi:MAG: hypothetical protein IT302_07920 [Dehalococcoidia bacterium]|nr:hypothetical protein [Dehalococcoidia bacterium]
MKRISVAVLIAFGVWCIGALAFAPGSHADEPPKSPAAQPGMIAPQPQAEITAPRGFTCPGATVSFPLASGYIGWVKGTWHPVDHTDNNLHSGIDVWLLNGSARDAPADTPVFAPIAGKLVRMPSHGVGIYIENTSLDLTVYVTHVLFEQNIKDLIAAGGQVQRGQLLGFMQIGGETLNHVHMSMGRTGFNDTVSSSWLDPAPLLGTRALTSPSASDWTIDTATQNTRSLDQWCTSTRPIRGNGTFLVNELGKYDDESSEAIALPATWNFFGTALTQVWVNNNGNVTFDGPLGTWVPFALNSTNRVIIAPFFTDIDTRQQGSRVVTYGSGTVDGRRAFAVNWLGVGAYNSSIESLDSFQLVLIDRGNISAGDFDIEFNYDKLQFDSGDYNPNACARVGYSVAGSAWFEMTGSGTCGQFLDDRSSALVNGSRNSSQTGRYVIQVRSGLANTAPGAPANVVAQPNGSGRVRVDWSDTSPASTVAFSVYRWKWGIGNPTELAAVVPASQHQYTDTGLPDSTFYYYWVVASNTYGGTWSERAEVKTSGNPSAPSNMSAIARSRTSVQVTWFDNASNELGYVLLRSDGGIWTVATWLPANTTSYLDTGLSPNHYYYYWVWSYGWNGASVAPSIALALTYP